MSYLNISTDEEILQGHKLDSVKSRTASIKVILSSLFISKITGAPKVLQQECVF